VIRIISDHIFSPLGISSEENYRAVISGKSGIQKIDNPEIWPEPFYGAAFTVNQKSLLAEQLYSKKYSLLESAMIYSISQAISAAGVDFTDGETQLIITTTKGNIDLLQTEGNQPKRALLGSLNQQISGYFGLTNPAVLVSNACTSGLMGIILAARMIQAKQAKRVVVCGGDLLTRFTLSGFQSFMAVSPEPCKPFDANRTGISLGEAVGIVVMAESDDQSFPAYISGASANDANHISGPSRNGEGLFLAVQRTLQGTNDLPGMISAHGTATPFNDEMEAQAFNRYGLQNIPLHSLKGNYGHTLGAAGLIETIVGLHAMQAGKILPSKGFENHGVTLPLNVSQAVENADYQYFLKTSSGFGGCNAAALFSKS
jgi:3-oxoacyl-[acyl-carrier-protein] synthase I